MRPKDALEIGLITSCIDVLVTLEVFLLQAQAMNRESNVIFQFLRPHLGIFALGISGGLEIFISSVGAYVLFSIAEWLGKKKSIHIRLLSMWGKGLSLGFTVFPLIGASSWLIFR